MRRLLVMVATIGLPLLFGCSDNLPNAPDGAPSRAGAETTQSSSAPTRPPAPRTTRPASVRVPDVVGLTLDQAKTLLDGANLIISVQFVSAGESLSPGPPIAEWVGWTATTQNPAGAASLPPRQLVMVVASPTGETGFLAALAAEGLVFELDIAYGVCETLDAGGEPPNPEYGDQGTLPAQYLAENWAVGTGSEEAHLASLAVENLCPEHVPTLQQARSGNYPLAPPLPQLVRDGTFVVGEQVSPGTYRTGRVSDCYWARLRSDGGIIDNDFASAALEIVVMIQSSDAIFETQNCGTWTRDG